MLPGYERLHQTSRRTRLQERGLPGGEDLLCLAKVYLDSQRRYWPKAFDVDGLHSGLTVNRLADTFAESFRAGAVPEFDCEKPNGAKAIAGCYLRYSCENSNPRSLDDQLDAILKTAKTNDHFIPWRYVLADSSVSGTIAVRRGYVMAKDVMQERLGRPSLETLYVYDMSRASRDIVESHKLARFARQINRNIVGVADGFDLNSPHAEMQLMAMSMYSTMLLSSVRERVVTGMRGAAARATSTGKPALGYKLHPKLDAAGHAQLTRHGGTLKERVIDPETSKFVELAFRLVGIEHKSYEAVRAIFNQHRVGGKNNWWPMDIRTMLANPVYIGVHIFNRNRKWIDPETGKPMQVERPRREWSIFKRPEWRIVSDDLWKCTRRRCEAVRAAAPQTGPKPGFRQKLHPKTILSGTLICEHCKKPLSFSKGGKHRFFCCNRGLMSIGGCRLRNKSVKIVEPPIVNAIRDKLLGPEQMAILVRKANDFLTVEAARPKVDVIPLKRELKSIERKLCQLTDAIADRNAKEVRTVVTRIEQLEGQRRDLLKSIRDGEERHKRPTPLTLETVQRCVDKLWQVLSQEPAMAAPVLRRLTGEILVRAEPIPGRKRQLWIARFRGNVIPILAEHSPPREQTPDSYTLDLLTIRNWSFEISGIISIDTSPPTTTPMPERGDKYHLISAKVLELRKLGASWYRIAKQLQTFREVVMNGYAYAVTGTAVNILKRNGRYKSVLQLPPVACDVKT